MKILSSFILFLSFISFTYSQTSNNSTVLSDTCMYDLYPIFAGGSSNEYFNCMLYDEVSGYVISGG